MTRLAEGVAKMTISVLGCIFIAAAISTLISSVCVVPSMICAVVVRSRDYGSALDNTHEWRYVRGGGRISAATKQDVFDHYHGRGGYDARRESSGRVLKIIFFTVSSIITLAAVGGVVWYLNLRGANGTALILAAIVSLFVSLVTQFAACIGLVLLSNYSGWRWFFALILVCWILVVLLATPPELKGLVRSLLAGGSQLH
jgi:hypothetical protein